jgi:hypothetical protein
MLQPKLLLIMQRELDSCGLELTANGRQQVEQLVTYGVDRMRRSHALEHPGLMINAEQNLKSLVKYLAGRAREAGTFPNLSPQDFDSAMRACPTLWPYCSSG